MDTKNYEHLLLHYGKRDSIPYYELLNTLEWKSKRATIIARDKNKCQNCGMSETIYLDRAPYHFHLEGEDDYDLIEDEDGIIIGARKNLKLVPAPRNVSFHVHHTYYIFNCNPWDYSDEALLTLCSYCHFELHKSTTIQWVDANNVFSNLTPCPRCNGAGSFPEYSHVQGGKCFYCKGAMYKEFMA
jgi:hypothetical protein